MVVFEAAEQAGGRDTAALFFLSPDLFRNTFKLLDDLGMAGDILEISPHAGQVYRGRVYRHRVASATGLLGFKGLNIADKTQEWNWAMPKFVPGRYHEIAAFQKRQRRPGLFFCGDYLLGPFIEAAITTGLRVAEAVSP